MYCPSRTAQWSRGLCSAGDGKPIPQLIQTLRKMGIQDYFPLWVICWFPGSMGGRQLFLKGFTTHWPAANCSLLISMCHRLFSATMIYNASLYFNLSENRIPQIHWLILVLPLKIDILEYTDTPIFRCSQNRFNTPKGSTIRSFSWKHSGRFGGRNWGVHTITSPAAILAKDRNQPTGPKSNICREREIF